MLKKGIFGFLFACLCLSIPAGIKRLTRGFHIAKMQLEIPFCPEWNVATDLSNEQAARILSQPFQYFGKGTQCYVFLSDDGNHILKIFRFDDRKRKKRGAFKHCISLEGIAKLHSDVNSRSLCRIRFFANCLRPSGYVNLQKNEPALRSSNLHREASFAIPSLGKRKPGPSEPGSSNPNLEGDRNSYPIIPRSLGRGSLLESCALAATFAREETGLVYVHLNKTVSTLPVLNAKDPLGRSFKLPLDSYRFVLQKRAEPLAAVFCEARLQGSLLQRMEDMLLLLEKRIAKGIENQDSNVSRNFGFLNGRAIEFDFGRYVFRSDFSDKTVQRTELQRYVRSLRSWLEKHAPELLDAFDQQVQRSFP